MWWLIVGDVVDYCWRCGGLLLEIWWLIVEDVVAHCWRCGDSLLEMRCFMGGDVVAHWLRTSLLGQRSRVLYSASPMHNDSDALLDHCVIMYTISV